MSMPACSHLMSNFDGTLLVGDGSGTPVDVKDTSGYTIDNDPYLYVFDVAKQAYFRVARHDTWATVANSRRHPSASFVYAGRWRNLVQLGQRRKTGYLHRELPAHPEMLQA